MFDHHRQTLNNAIKKLDTNPEIIAVLLGGSIAHGFAREDSDVDILIVITDEEYQKKKAKKNLLYWEKESSTYPDGYVDGKFINREYIKKVAESGNEPSRYAFKGAQIVFTRDPSLENLIAEAGKYDISQKENRIMRFLAQTYAWQWYYKEGIKKENDFIRVTATSNLALAAGRVILAYNEQLYPYIKWFLPELGRCEKSPENFAGDISSLLNSPSAEKVDNLVKKLTDFNDWGFEEFTWPVYFANDVELPWMTHEPFWTDL